MPCAHRSVITAPRSRRLHASRTSLRVKALHYLPDARDVHCHGVLPVPLVARLSRMFVGQSSINGTDEFRK